jgi:hypothetical protein
MQWLFSRDHEQIRLTRWYDQRRFEYVVDIAYPDGGRESQRFASDADFERWLAGWDHQLAPDRWSRSGPFFSNLDGSGPHALATPLDDGSATLLISASTRRTYRNGLHIFDVTLSSAVLRDQPLWTIALVTETSRTSKRVSIPGIHAIASASPDATFARACDCIDKWLLANPRA